MAQLTDKVDLREHVMKKVLLAGVAAVAMATGAQAADLGSPRTAIPGVAVAPAGFNWTGFYLGGHLGAGINSTSTRYIAGGAPTYDAVNFSRSPSGFLGGVQMGYNWQVSPNAIVGVEGAFSLASTSTRFVNGVGVLGAPDVVRASNPFLGNISVRAGLTAERALIFGKVGLAIGSFNYSQTDILRSSMNSTRAGLLLGAGIEYAVAPNWTIGAEYNYNMFGSYNLTNTALGTNRIRNDVHVGKITLNYLFSSGAISARY